MRVLILGIGNILASDDGLGVYAAKYIEQNYSFSPPLDIYDGNVEGIGLLNILAEYDEVVVLDAIEAESGEIYSIPAKDLRASSVKSAHEIGIIETLELLELSSEHMPNVVVFAIGIESVDELNSLSISVQNAFDKYIVAILEYIASLGVVYERINNMPLTDIIESF